MTDNEEEQIYSIALTMVPGIGHIGAKRLVEGMKSATDVFRYRKELSERIPGVNERISAALDCPSLIARAEQELGFLQKNRIQCLTYYDEAYPSRLRECEDAPIVLLDEATASLDVENETKIQAGISELVRNKTVLIIAHRMRTVANADKIVVLENGSVAEMGTPEELKKKNGIFARMVNRQVTNMN